MIHGNVKRLAPLSSEPWRCRAACLGASTEMFFADDNRGRGNISADSLSAKALAICAVCPVAAECLESALADPSQVDSHGIRGGLLPSHRQMIRRRRKAEQQRQGQVKKLEGAGQTRNRRLATRTHGITERLRRDTDTLNGTSL